MDGEDAPETWTMASAVEEAIGGHKMSCGKCGAKSKKKAKKKKKK